jgi:DNA-directed RNA polymerase subunit omega
MARVTVEDCLEREENRFALVIMAAKRTRNLMKGESSLVACKNKPLVAALREIAAGKVAFDRRTSDVVEEWVAQQRSKYADTH